jgi:TolA-binding protein
VLAAAKVAVATLVEAGRTKEAKALIGGLLDGVQAQGVAASLLVEHAWVALDSAGVDEAEDSVRAAAKIAEAAGEQGAAAGTAVAEAAFFVGEARFEAGEQQRAADLYALAATKGTEQVAARACYKEGFARLALGDDAGAVRAFTALCERHRTSELVGEGLFLLGETHFRAGRYAEAATALQRLRQEQPRHEVLPKALFRLGVAEAQLGRWAEAEEALTRLLRDTPEFENAVEAELWRGRALAERKNARGARAAYERVIALDKGVLSARARLGLGALAHAAGEHEEALSQYLKVAVLYAHEDEVSQALLMAGQCLEDLGDTERAAAQYRELVEKYPRSELAARARERLRGLQQK